MSDRRNEGQASQEVDERERSGGHRDAYRGTNFCKIAMRVMRKDAMLQLVHSLQILEVTGMFGDPLLRVRNLLVLFTPIPTPPQKPKRDDIVKLLLLNCSSYETLPI
jgi:hypothetical protein